MIDGTLDLEGKGTAASLPSVLLFAGEVMRDTTKSTQEREQAARAFGEVLALAAANGWRGAPRLRALVLDGHYSTPEASCAARMALSFIPPEDARAALARAGFIDGAVT